MSKFIDVTTDPVDVSIGQLFDSAMVLAIGAATGLMGQLALTKTTDGRYVVGVHLKEGETLPNGKPAGPHGSFMPLFFLMTAEECRTVPIAGLGAAGEKVVATTAPPVKGDN